MSEFPITELTSPTLGIVGDLHIGIYEHEKPYVEYQFQSLEFYLEEFRSRGIRRVVFLGDVFHHRKWITQITLRNLRRFRKLLKEYEIEPIFICGNHDTYYKSTNSLNTLKFLLRGPHMPEGNIIVDDKCHEFFYGNGRFLCVPWMNKENNVEICRQIKRSKAKYCFGHLELSGFDLMPGVKSLTSHFKDQKLLDKFRDVITGHFHHANRHENIFYLGAPYEMTWTDYEVKKQCLVLNFETCEEELIFNPYSFFRKIIIDDKEEFPDETYYHGKNIKVYLNVKRTIKIEKFLNDVVEKSNRCNIINNEAIINDINADIEVSKSLSVTDIWKDYIETCEYDEKKKTALTSLFIETYNTVTLEDQ